MERSGGLASSVGLQLGQGGEVIHKLLRRAQLRLPAQLPGPESPVVRRLRRLVVGTLSIAAVGLGLQVGSAALGWHAYRHALGRAGLSGLRHWLFRYVAMDTLLPVCLVLAEPLDPAQPLMCASVTIGAISLRFRDFDLAWRVLAPDTCGCAAYALVLGLAGALCLLAVAICACAVGRHVLCMQLIYGPVGPALRQALSRIAAVPPSALSLGLECSICLEAHGEQVQSSGGGDWCELQCKHRFHRRCILKWLQRQRCCPLCRWNLHTVVAAGAPTVPWEGSSGLEQLGEDVPWA